MHKFFSMYFFLFITLYTFLSTSCSSSGETNCINTASGNSHSLLVAEMCAGWEKTRVINRNKYIEKNLCITLVIYQEPLHDAGQHNVKVTLCGITLAIIRTLYMSSSLSYCRGFNFNCDKPASTRRICRVQEATRRLQALFSLRYRLSGLW